MKLIISKLTLILFLFLPLFVAAEVPREIITSFDLDINNDGIKEKICLLKGLDHKNKDKDYGRVILSVEADTKKSKISLARLQFKNIKLSELTVTSKINEKEQKTTFLIVESKLGTRDTVLKLYTFNDGNLQEEANFISDAGVIQIKDINNDNVKDIIVLTRDYKNNPLKDFVVLIYSYQDNVWQQIASYYTFNQSYNEPKDILYQEVDFKNVDSELNDIRTILNDCYETLKQTPHSPIK